MSDKVRLLLLDDPADLRFAMSRTIQEGVPNSVFLGADDIKEAKNILESQGDPIDLIIMDPQSGRGFQERLWLLNLQRKWGDSRAQIPVIVFTSYPNIGWERAALEAGAGEYIQKLDPDSTEKLREAVMRMLGEKRIGRIPSTRSGERGLLGVVGEERRLPSLEGKVAEDRWTDGEVDAAVSQALKPYKETIQVMKLGFSLLLVEVGIAALYLLWRLWWR